MKSSCHFFFSHLGMPTKLSNSNSPVSVLHDANLYSTNLRDSPRPIYDSRYIDAARTRVSQKFTCHVIATHCCMTKPRARNARALHSNGPCADTKKTLPPYFCVARVGTCLLGSCLAMPLANPSQHVCLFITWSHNNSL
jgi:hypothetical protein